MFHIICDVVVLYMEFVDAVSVPKAFNLGNYVFRTSPTKAVAPKVRGCTERAFGAAAAARIDLTDTITHRIGRLIGSILEIKVHSVEIPAGKRDLIQFRPIAIFVPLLFPDQVESFANYDLIVITKGHSVQDRSISMPVQDLHEIQERKFGFTQEHVIKVPVLQTSLWKVARVCTTDCCDDPGIHALGHA